VKAIEFVADNEALYWTWKNGILNEITNHDAVLLILQVI